jgi:hypothetical protein
VAAVGLAALAGCKSTMSDFMEAEDFVVSAPNLRGAQIDVEASTLDWQAKGLNPDRKEGIAEQMKAARTDLAHGFDLVLGATKGKPARFRVTVIETDRDITLAIVPCFGVLVMFGCPTETNHAKVKVELEVDGNIYEATGESSAVGFLYSDEIAKDKPKQADRVAEAVVDALRKIDAKAGGATTGRDVRIKSARGAAKSAESPRKPEAQ